MYPPGIKYVLILLVIVLAGNACRNKWYDSTVHQGKIIYDITFPNEKNSVLMDLYPKELNFHFKGDLFHSQVKTSYDLLATDIIVNTEEKSMAQLLKNMSKRYSIKLDRNETEEWLKQYPAMRLEPTDETVVIAGYTCNKTIAHFPNDSIPPIELYHTKGLGLSNDNWWNQYQGLDGFLLGYEIEQFGKRMRVRAREIKFEAVPDSKFEIPSDYVPLGPDEMYQQITAVVEEYM